MPDTKMPTRDGSLDGTSDPGVLERLSELGNDQRAMNDVVRKLFTLRRKVVEYKGFTCVVREVARIHRRGNLAGVSESLQIVGQTGSGKTTLLRWYAGHFPKTEIDGQTVIPVLFVETPEAPSVKSLAEAVLIALGDPWAHKGTATEKTERILHLCKLCQVELIIIDEIQHFIDSDRRSELKRVTEWLKQLINRLARPVILAGLPRSILVTRSNPQLRRRFAAPFYLEPFGFETKEQQLEFRGLLKAFAKDLPPGSIDIATHAEAIRLFYASCGLIDYVVKLLDDAASRGGSGPDGAVLREDLAASFVRVVWYGAPERLNPFNEKAKLRLLRRPGEPFEIWDDIQRYLGTAGSRERAAA